MFIETKRQSPFLKCKTTSRTALRRQIHSSWVNTCELLHTNVKGVGGYNHTYADFLTPQAWIFLPYWQQWKGFLTFCSSVFNIHFNWTDLWFWTTGMRSLIFFTPNSIVYSDQSFLWCTRHRKTTILLTLNLLQYFFLIKHMNYVMGILFFFKLVVAEVGTSVFPHFALLN